MVFTYYLYKYPYKLAWYLLKFLNKNSGVVAYCADPLDYIVLKPVLFNLPDIPVIAKNRRTVAYLQKQGISCNRLPCFPRAVIMGRHAAHKFPEEKIVKIGFRHGAYYFKAFANAKYYNAFDLFFLTCQKEVEEAVKTGIEPARAIGFPKLDPVFNGSINEQVIKSVSNRANLNPGKKTIIFTATWDKSGMSAIHRWIDKVHNFTNAYNVLITVHPWTSKKYLNRLKKTDGVFFIQDPDVLPYLVIADVLVGDTSSIIAEFCVMDKPIITFKVAETKRSVPEITQLLKEISIQVESVNELQNAIEYSFKNPGERSKERQKASQMMFDQLDGQAGKRAADIIKKEFPDLFNLYNW